MRKSLLFAVVCCMSLGIGQVNATVPTQTELAEAVRKGDVKLVQKLIKQGAPVNAKDREGKTPIFYTIYAEKTLYSTDEGETVYDCKQPYIHKGDYSDCFSSSKEHLKIAEILINNGANINENPKFSLLYTALKNPDKSVAKLLINKGANINIANSDDYFHDTPLHLAVQMNDIETAKLLINKGANIHAKNVLGNTPLYSATTKEMAELLVNNGAAINARNNEELTPLHQSGRYLYNEEVLSFLISQVEDIDMGAYPVTPLQKMVEDNNMAGAKLLIEHGANVNAKDSNGTPVIAYTTDKEMMDFLISKGAKTDNLITAIVLNDMDTAKDLINHKGGYNIKGANNQNALHYAAEYNNLEIAKMLIKKGVDVNAEDKNGKTPLHIAALKSDIKMVKLLVKNGANVNANNYGTAEPLYLAMFNKNDKNHKILKYLIKKGANVNTQMGNITALWAAANEGLEESGSLGTLT